MIAPLAPMALAMLLISGWALYNRRRADVQADWQRIALLVLGHSLLIVVVGTMLLFPSTLPVVAFSVLALIAIAVLLWRR